MAKRNSKKKLDNQKDIEKITIGKTEYSLKYISSLPPMQKQKFDEFVEDIRQRGIMVPVMIDELGNVIDGAHRVRAAHILGLKSIPTIIKVGLIEDEKMALAQDLNLHRRQLTPKQIKEIVSENKKTVPILAVKLRKEGKSLRQIAGELGVSAENVRQIIKKATAQGLTVDLPTTIVGKDGKRRKAKTSPKFCPTIYTTTGSETQRAIQACKTAGDALPQKNITLKRVERIAREKTKADQRKKEYQDFKQGQVTLLLGDFRKKCDEIEDSSVDVIFTDPLYSKEALPLWDDLGQLCLGKLKPGGLLITYTSSLYLPQVHETLGEHLSYLWTAAILHTGGKNLIHAVKVQQAWKPILIYYKPPLNKYWGPFTDIVSGGQSKEHHDWEQSVVEAHHYIKALCPANGILLDPMMGSATTIVAGLQSGLGLECIGVEIDQAAYATSQERVQKVLDELSKRRESA